MSKHQVTQCDNCREEIPLYHGAVVDVLEQCHVLNRAAPNRDRVLFDLCDTCYQPIALALGKIEETRIRRFLEVKP